MKLCVYISLSISQEPNFFLSPTLHLFFLHCTIVFNTKSPWVPSPTSGHHLYTTSSGTTSSSSLSPRPNKREIYQEASVHFSDLHLFTASADASGFPTLRSSLNPSETLPNLIDLKLFGQPPSSGPGALWHMAEHTISGQYLTKARQKVNVVNSNALGSCSE